MRKVMALVGTLVLFLSLPKVGATESSVPLPLRKVVLYKNGMGYFEHLGKVRGAEDVEIVLPSAQLNDVLKSLTVIDLGGGAGNRGDVRFDRTTRSATGRTPH